MSIMCRRPLLLGALLLCGACATTNHSPDYLAAPPGPPRPFSPAVRAGGLLFLAGQLGTDSTGSIVKGGIQAETRQAMENIRAVLSRAGSSTDRIAKCTVFLADMREWDAMNEVYVTYFPEGRRPARTAAGANGLARGGKVEIECIAVE
jgi:reactive intermediate/imine deaminase